jgi:hypothetical protein
MQEAFRTPSSQAQNRISSHHIILKILIIENKERILKPAREGCQITYKGKPIRITNFSTEISKARRALEQCISSSERK